MKLTSLLISSLCLMATSANADSSQLGTFKSSLPNACQERTADVKTAFDCANNQFTVDGKPINPLIIKDFSSLLSDMHNQVVGINLLNSQNSNRYFNDGYDLALSQKGDVFNVKVTHPEQDCEGCMFSYETVGKTENGIWVVLTAESTSGSGVFQNLMFVKLSLSKGYAESKDGTLSLTDNQVIIEKLYEMPLGERAHTDIQVEGNTVNISIEPYPSGEKTFKTVKVQS